jgi:DNA-directed RNA polymerase specialized sigma24 family protein
MADYVDKKEFYEEMKKYMKNPDVGVSNKLGKMIFDTCYNLQYHRKFIRYSQEEREELVGDGIENCLRYMKNFKPDEYDNPHAYFTQIAYYAFIRKIMKEYKEKDKKEAMYDENYVMSSGFSLQDHDYYEKKFHTRFEDAEIEVSDIE